MTKGGPLNSAILPSGQLPTIPMPQSGELPALFSKADKLGASRLRLFPMREMRHHLHSSHRAKPLNLSWNHQIHQFQWRLGALTTRAQYRLISATQSQLKKKSVSDRIATPHYNFARRARTSTEILY